LGGNPLCVSILLDRGAGREGERDRWGLTPLELAIRERVPEIVEIESLLRRVVVFRGSEEGREGVVPGKGVRRGEGERGGEEGEDDGRLILEREQKRVKTVSSGGDRGGEGGMKGGEEGREGGREGGGGGLSTMVGSLASWAMGKPSYLSPSSSSYKARHGMGDWRNNSSSSSSSSSQSSITSTSASSSFPSSASSSFPPSSIALRIPINDRMDKPPSGAGQEGDREDGREGGRDDVLIETAVWCDARESQKEREATSRRMEEERRLAEALMSRRDEHHMMKKESFMSGWGMGEGGGGGDGPHVRTKGRERKTGNAGLFAQMSAEEEVEEGGGEGRMLLSRVEREELKEGGEEGERGRLMTVTVGAPGVDNGGRGGEAGGEGGEESLLQVWTRRGAAAAAAAVLVTCALTLPVWL